MTESSESTPQINFELETKLSKNTYTATWRVTNFDLWHNKVGTFIQSNTFTTNFEGMKKHWFMKIYPLGCSELFKGYVSLLIECQSECIASFKFAILDQDNIEQCVVKRDNVQSGSTGPGNDPFHRPFFSGATSLPSATGNQWDQNQSRTFGTPQSSASVPLGNLSFSSAGVYTANVSGAGADVATANSSGCGQFVKRDKLFEENSKLLVNGTLTILCVITTTEMKNVMYRKGVLSRSDRPTVRLSLDLGNLLKSSRLSDLTIIAGGREFHVHRTILAARSPGFSALFESKENSSGRVDIPDIGSRTMETLLNFIYTGDCSDLDEVVEDLLRASDKYQLNELKEICSNDLFARITSDNASSLLALATLCKAPELKINVLQYIIFHFKDVLISEGWKNLSTTNPSLALEVKDQIIKQFVLNN